MSLKYSTRLSLQDGDCKTATTRGIVFLTEGAAFLQRVGLQTVRSKRLREWKETLKMKRSDLNSLINRKRTSSKALEDVIEMLRGIGSGLANLDRTMRVYTVFDEVPRAGH